MGQGSDTDFPSTASMSFVFTAIFDGNVNVVGHVVGISGAAQHTVVHIIIVVVVVGVGVSCCGNS